MNAVYLLAGFVSGAVLASVYWCLIRTPPKPDDEEALGLAVLLVNAERQRDELLAEFKPVLDSWARGADSNDYALLIGRARAAIAKVEADREKFQRRA